MFYFEPQRKIYGQDKIDTVGKIISRNNLDGNMGTKALL